MYISAGNFSFNDLCGIVDDRQLAIDELDL